MKQIYFSNENAQSAGKRVLKATIENTTSALSSLFPKWSIRMAEKVLCTPNRPKQNKMLGQGFTESTLSVMGHEIRLYKKGNFDRTVLMTHGWSGSAADFTIFYEAFNKLGYNVLAFDHIAHGQSSGKVVNLFLFIKSIEAVLNHAEATSKLAGIVAHSMGGSAVISALPGRRSSIPIALVSPVVPLFETLYESVKTFGISEKWLSLLLRHLEKRYSMVISDIDPKNQIHKLQNPLLIIQDKNDSYINLEMNKTFMPERALNALTETEGLGHFRILKSADVIRKTSEFINAQQN